jgi:hypothetical protein
MIPQVSFVIRHLDRGCALFAYHNHKYDCPKLLENGDMSPLVAGYCTTP